MKSPKVEFLESPACAWMVKYSDGYETGVARAFVGRVAVVEVQTEGVLRVDVRCDGERVETHLPALPDGCLKRIAMLDVEPLGADRVCVKDDTQAWLLAPGAPPELLSTNALAMTLLADGSVVFTLGSETGAETLVLSIGANGERTQRASLNSPLVEAFSFPAVDVHLHQGGNGGGGHWMAEVHPKGRAPRRIGGLFEALSLLWFDGWLVVVPDSGKVRAVPVASSRWIYRLLFSSSSPLAAVGGIEFVPGAQKLCDRVRRAVGPDLNGWSLVPFSEYSVNVEVAPKSRRYRWTNLRSAETGVWTFELPDDDTAVLVLSPEPVRLVPLAGQR